MRNGGIRSRRAVSGIIGGVFFVTVILISSSAGIWYYAQQRNLYAQRRDAFQLQQQRTLEQFAVPRVLISQSGQMNATVQNLGTIPIHIVDIIITSKALSVTHNIYNVSYYINPGNTTKNIGQSLPLSLSQSGTYTLFFVTERGNLVSAIYSPTQLMGYYATFGNVGYLSVSFDQNSFQYKSKEQSTWTSAWTFSKGKVCGEEPIFQIYFRNHGVFPAYILHWSEAQLWGFASNQGGGTPQDFFIVDGSSTPGNLRPYTDNTITVPFSLSGDWQTGGTPTPIVFGSTTLSPNTQVQDLSGCGLDSIYDFFIEVSYTYNGQQFNQLIPYAAAIVTTS